MNYTTTITQKGQITIPKDLRELLNLKKFSRIILELERGRKIIKMKPAPDILDLAGEFKPRQIKSALKVREEFEKTYQRT